MANWQDNTLGLHPSTIQHFAFFSFPQQQPNHPGPTPSTSQRRSRPPGHGPPSKQGNHSLACKWQSWQSRDWFSSKAAGGISRENRISQWATVLWFDVNGWAEFSATRLNCLKQTKQKRCYYGGTIEGWGLGAAACRIQSRAKFNLKKREFNVLMTN